MKKFFLFAVVCLMVFPKLGCASQAFALSEPICVCSSADPLDSLVYAKARAVASTPEAARTQALMAAMSQAFAFSDARQSADMLQADEAFFYEEFYPVRIYQKTVKKRMKLSSRK